MDHPLDRFLVWAVNTSPLAAAVIFVVLFCLAILLTGAAYYSNFGRRCRRWVDERLGCRHCGHPLPERMSNNKRRYYWCGCGCHFDFTENLPDP